MIKGISQTRKPWGSWEPMWVAVGSPQDPQESEKRWCPTPCCFGCGTMRLIQERSCKNGVRSFRGRIGADVSRFISWFWYQKCFSGRFLRFLNNLVGSTKWYGTVMYRFLLESAAFFGVYKGAEVWNISVPKSLDVNMYCTTSRRSSWSFNSNVVSKIS